MRRVVKIDGEARQHVALVLGGLAHDGGGGDQAECVEGRRRHDCHWDRSPDRRQHAIVVDAARDVADRIGGGDRQQRVGVVADAADTAEGIDQPERQEEMAAVA